MSKGLVGMLPIPFMGERKDSRAKLVNAVSMIIGRVSKRL